MKSDRAMRKIARVLRQPEWDMSTLNTIAEIVATAGYLSAMRKRRRKRQRADRGKQRLARHIAALKRQWGM